MKNMLSKSLPLLLLLTTLSLTQCAKRQNGLVGSNNETTNQTATQTKFYPYQTWKDTNGNVINAHSAGVYFEKGVYYWYGEHKFPGSSEEKGAADGGMHAYRSTDLMNWTDLGVVLPVDKENPNSDVAYGCIFQRPKVVYNGKTRTYVAYFKLYLKGAGYDVCHVGVGVATSPAGPFTYQGKFLPACEKGTGDFALHQEPNGDLYHVAVRKTDRLMVRAKMTDDYLKPATEYVVCPGITKSTEAPALIFRAGTYHLLGSGSSGWNPNPARYFTSTSLDGPWTDHGNPVHGTNPITGLDSTKTFGGQSTFFLPIQGADNQYIALFDDWKPANPIDSRYIWLPFRVKNNRIDINWLDSWDVSWFKTH